MKKILCNLIMVVLICSIVFTTNSIAFNNEDETNNKMEIEKTEAQKELEPENNNNNNEENLKLQEENKIEETEKKDNIELEKEDSLKQEESIKTIESVENTDIQKNIENEENTQKLRTLKSINKPVVADGIYEICSVADQSKVINAENNNYSNLTNINLGTNKKLKRQKFYITYDAQKEAYIIKSMKENKVLDVNGGVKENSTNIQLYEYNGTLAQQWEIKEIEKNKYTIFSKGSDKCVDIKWRNYTRWFKYSII